MLHAMTTQTQLPAELRHREIAEEREFNSVGLFKAIVEAEMWLESERFSFGIMQSGAPTAILKGKHFISKWRNLRREEIASLDGLMTGDFRNGPVKVVIFKR